MATIEEEYVEGEEFDEEDDDAFEYEEEEDGEVEDGKQLCIAFEYCYLSTGVGLSECLPFSRK